MLTPALALAGMNQSFIPQEEEVDEETPEDVVGECSILMAVPKRRVSHRRKRIKFNQKHLKPIESFVACKKCGEMHPQYYQVCPFCQPFNNFIKNKDTPVREYDRVKRVVEAKILDDLLAKQQEKKAQKAAKAAAVSASAATKTDNNDSGNNSSNAIKPQ